jgi:Carboxypeptidase regulatory-like domain
MGSPFCGKMAINSSMPFCVALRVVAVVFGSGLIAFAQKRESCTLLGSVVNSATNAGIAHALVAYFGTGIGYRFTDAGGNFRVPGLPCGSYTLTMTKPGFVAPQDESSQPVLLGPMLRNGVGEQAEEESALQPTPADIFVTITANSQPVRAPLTPVASVAGTVLDENGEPIYGVAVQGIAIQPSLNGTDYVPVRTAHTDDAGHYALLNLTPGDYLVRLTGESSSTQYFQGVLNPNNDHRGMQPVYYPNADSLAAAGVLHLAPADLASADFRQATESAFDVNGRLSGFIPQAWTRFRLYRDGDRAPVSRAFVNLTTGQFRLTDIVRGSYTLRVEQYQADPPLWLAGEQPLTILAAPIRDLDIHLSGAIDIPVSISYEDGAEDHGFVQLVLRPQHAPENMRDFSTTRPQSRKRHQVAERADAPPPPKAFTNVIPDKYKLSAQASGGGYVASAKLGDTDVLHGEFSISGEATDGLHITIRGDSASVQGQVTFQGQPSASVVYLIPEMDDGAGVKAGGSGPDGQYEIRDVPPGVYRIRAWTASPAAKQILASEGETLTLQPGEHQTVALEAAAPEQK